MRKYLIISLSSIALGLLLFVLAFSSQAARSQHVYLGSDERLVYVPYPNGDTIPDFSNVGYGGGGVAIPSVPVVKTVEPAAGDDGGTIQAAIDEVSARSPDCHGFRGAILLKAGAYEVEGTITIRASGIVLRGEGEGENGTLIRATGTTPRTLINVAGVGNRIEVAGTRQAIADSYLPVGARTIDVADASGFQVGDRILVVRTPNQEWIDAIGMDACATKGTGYDTSDVVGSTCISAEAWTPAARTMRYERLITAVNGNRITLEAPMVEAFQAEFGGGYVAKYEFPGRIENCGIEYLRSESAFASETDENHANYLISLTNVENAWVRHATSVYFVQGTIFVGAGARYVTVQDSSSLDHKSVITGDRRYPFNLDDCSFVLVMRCYSKTGRHDFVTGSNTPGPNVFFDSRAEESYSELGPHHRWATGSLFDLIRHDSFNQDQIIGTYNRGNSGTGHGWSGAYQLFWNIVGDRHRLSSPPLARNWSIGSQARRNEGTGEFELFGTPVLPSSLYLAQLRDRLGPEALSKIGYSVMPPLPAPPGPLPTTSPAPAAEPEAASGSASGCEQEPRSLRVFRVSSIADLQARINSAVAGDRIVVANGKYALSGAINVSRRGAELHPIVISAETLGGVEITGSAGFNLTGASSHVIVEGFRFVHAAGGANIRAGATHCRFTRNLFELTGQGNYLTVSGDDCEVDHNTFQNKSTPGNMLSIQGPGGSGMAQRTWIHHNFFQNFSSIGGNGGETMRVGLSGRSLTDAHTLVEHNLFVKCDGENELISNKSCANTYRYNTFLNTVGELTLRHGNNCEVYGNYFINSHGIRFFGNDHRIFSNYLENCDPAIQIGNGDTEIPPGALTGHDRPDRVEVSFNTLVNNLTNVIMPGRTDELGATDLVFANNIIQSDAKTMLNLGGPLTNPRFEGNIVFGAAANGDLPLNGARRVDPQLVRDLTGLFRLRSRSPAIDAAVGSYPAVTVDMNGQGRTGVKDVGADEYSGGVMGPRPLTTSDVGPHAP